MKKDFTRRGFLKNSGILAATVPIFMSSANVHAGENGTIKVALVGCGNRGSGALRQALNADPQAKLWAVADMFKDKAHNMVKAITEATDKKQIDITTDRIFDGMDAYKKAIDSLDSGDVVILATPQAFRPLHFEYAVKKGVNIFAEKPLAVDVPGLKRIKAANEIAKEKGLKVAVGLNNRHFERTEETIKAIHDGKLGDILSLWVYRSQNPHRLKPIDHYTPMQHQIRNIFCFDWTSGGFIVDALIHNIDICCWAKNEWPIEAQGVGGRIARKEKDQLIDFGAIEFVFGDGKKLMLQTRTMNNVWHFFQANIQGSKGCTQVGEGVREPRIYSGFDMISKNRKEIWTPKSPVYDSYQREHDLFFKAIREDQTWNEIDYAVNSTFTAILGRMAMQTGQRLTAEKVWSSKFEYAPNIDQLSYDGPSPVMPDANGDYFIPIPGVFNFS